MHKSPNISLLIFILAVCLSTAGFVKASLPAGDLDSNCTIQFQDIRLFAEQWLNTSHNCSEPNCADIDGVNGVNISDFALLAMNWHKTKAPLVISEFMALNANGRKVNCWTKTVILPTG